MANAHPAYLAQAHPAYLAQTQSQTPAAPKPALPSGSGSAGDGGGGKGVDEKAAVWERVYSDMSTAYLVENQMELARQHENLLAQLVALNRVLQTRLTGADGGASR